MEEYKARQKKAEAGNGEESLVAAPDSNPTKARHTNEYRSEVDRQKPSEFVQSCEAQNAQRCPTFVAVREQEDGGSQDRKPVSHDDPLRLSLSEGQPQKRLGEEMQGLLSEMGIPVITGDTGKLIRQASCLSATSTEGAITSNESNGTPSSSVNSVPKS